MKEAPVTLEIYNYLQRRMHLSPSEKTKQQNLYKGYVGESSLHALLEKNLPSHYFCMTDILLESNQTEFQIDILLIGGHMIYPLEVKHYEGDFIIQDDRWYVVSSKSEIRNPIHQLKRMEILLKNVLGNKFSNFDIEPHIVFTHPEFYLYQAPLDLPLIFPTQLMRFIRKLQSASSHQSEQHSALVHFLEEQRMTQSTYAQLPAYSYEHLKKGIVCTKCSEFLVPFSTLKLTCKNCQTKERIETAIKRNLVEFMQLFPGKKITTNAIYDWCDIIQSKQSIRRVLKSHLTPIGKGKQTYYMNK